MQVVFYKKFDLQIHSIIMLQRQPLFINMGGVGKAQALRSGHPVRIIPKFQNGNTGMGNIKSRPKQHGRHLQQMGQPGGSEPLVTENRYPLLTGIHHAIYTPFAAIAQLLQKPIGFPDNAGISLPGIRPPKAG